MGGNSRRERKKMDKASWWKLLILCCIISAITIWCMKGTSPQHPAIQPHHLGEPGSHLGYLTVFYIHEQLSSAVHALVQLYNYSEHYWGLQLFEPFIVQTDLTLMPPLDMSTSTPFSTYFDRIDVLNKIQHCFNSSINLTSYTNFLVKAARTFIYLHISKNEKNNNLISECDIDMKPIEARLNEHVKKVAHLAIAEHGNDYFFSGWKAVCINYWHPFLMSRIGPFIRRLITLSCKSEGCLPEVTLVLSQWRRVVRTESTFFWTDPEYSDHMKDCEVFNITPTSYIVNTAQQFLQSLSLKRPFIGIHIRTEKLRRDTLDECMKKLNKTLYVAQNKYNITQERVVMIYDIRKHGSHTHAVDKLNFAKDVVTRVRSMNISIVEFNPTTLNVTHLSGLVPLVEKEFLASADVLVAVGGGRFQTTIINRYHQLHPQGDLYIPCH